MADLTASDVVVTLLPHDSYNPPGMLNTSFPTIVFGDASKTYPANGIPLPAMGLLGEFKKEIKRIIITSPPGDGYVYKWDKVNGTIRMYQGNGGTVSGATFTGTPLAAHTHDLRVIGGITADEALGVLASGPTLGKLAATNRVIAGADQATKGGVVGVSAGTPAGSLSGTITITSGPLAELGNVAVAITSLDLMVVGE
jgi:hypothetical protein